MKPLRHHARPDEPPADQSDRREGNRLPLVLNARCQTGYGSLSEVWLIDVSPTGCRLFACSGLLRAGQQIVISHWHDKGFRGQVVWASEMKAGVKFAATLPNGAMEYMLGAAGRPCIVPASDPEVLVDQYGRELAPLPPLTGRKTAR